MDTRFLQTLLSVIETGSAAETARRLNITPSAVSQRIKALEAEIGQPLLTRIGQRMGPTAAADAILDSAKRMIALEDDIRSAAAVDGSRGHLRIGVIQTALTGLMPDILLRLRRNRPGIDLYIVPGASGDLHAQLMAQELDLALLVKPHFALPKTLEWRTLRREPFMLISHPDQAGTPAETLLRTEPFLRYDRNHWGGQAVDAYLRSRRIRTNDQHELDSLEAIVVMVARGLGVSIIPAWPQPWPAGAEVARTHLLNAPRRAVGLLWSRSAMRLPLIQSVVEQAVGPF